jgi:transketolase
MLHETLLAAEMMHESGAASPRVINMPWLSHVDAEWLLSTLKDIATVYVIEDHCVRGGLGDRIGRVLSENPDSAKCQLRVFGIDESPECGTPQEVLKHHGLDGKSIAERILADLGKNRDGKKGQLGANAREVFDDQSAPQ